MITNITEQKAVSEAAEIIKETLQGNSERVPKSIKIDWEVKTVRKKTWSSVIDDSTGPEITEEEVLVPIVEVIYF